MYAQSGLCVPRGLGQAWWHAFRPQPSEGWRNARHFNDLQVLSPAISPLSRSVSFALTLLLATTTPVPNSQVALQNDGCILGGAVFGLGATAGRRLARAFGGPE